MKDTKILLTVSMLISGKGDMEKSLKSLMYFKNAFPTEIILTDTGCNPEQRSIAEKYADKILDFTWCNDFAMARNVGLREARGEWFLYLDDDEWFENPQEIIAFFQSGDYRNYNSACYMVRNYTNLRGTMYEDSFASRMVKREPGSEFVGKIHERLEPIRLPRKNFSDYVHHFGYAYRTPEELREHSKRNITLLLDQRKQYPGDPRWIAQLVQEYFSLKEYKKVIDECKKGLDEWKNLEDKGEYAPVFIGAIYAFILISLDSLKQFEEEKKWLEMAFQDPITRLNYMEPTVAYYCMAGARLYAQTKEYAICRDYLDRYIDAAKRLKDNKELLELGTACTVSGVFQEQLMYGTILQTEGAVIRTGDTALAEAAFYMMDWSDGRLLKQQKWELDMVDACCSVEYDPAWQRILQTLVSRKGGMEEMYVVFLQNEVQYRQQGERDKLLRLCRLVAGLDYEYYYILYNKIYWNRDDKDVCKELFRELFEKYPRRILDTRTDVWEVGEALHIPMNEWFLQVDFLTWRQETDQWLREASAEKLIEWNRRIASWKEQEDIRYDYFFMKCQEGYLVHYRELQCPETERMQKIEELLWHYAECVVTYYAGLYREEVIREIPELLPEDAQLAIALKRLQQYREAEEDKNVLRQLRNCIGVYPALEDVVEEYAGLYRDMVERKQREAYTAQNELHQIAQSLKYLAKSKIEEGSLQEAEKILRQVEQCVPSDTEVQQMLEQIAIEGNSQNE